MQSLWRITRSYCQVEEKTKTNEEEEALEPSSTFNRRINSKHTPTAKYLHVGHVQRHKMSSSEDSDVPEQVSLSTSKQQAIGRKKGVAKELSQAKLKRKEHNRERDRQLKEQSSKQRAELIPDEEESSSGEDEEPNDPRILPDHLFAAAFNQTSLIPAQSVLKDAPPTAQQKKRKRTDLTPKDKMIGRAFSFYSEGIRLTRVNSSRAVRTLSKTSERAAAKRTLPPSSIAKFSSRALNTKGIVSLSRTRGWERQAGERAQLFLARNPWLESIHSEYRRHENDEWTGSPLRSDLSSVHTSCDRMPLYYDDTCIAPRAEDLLNPFSIVLTRPLSSCGFLSPTTDDSC